MKSGRTPTHPARPEQTHKLKVVGAIEGRGAVATGSSNEMADTARKGNPRRKKSDKNRPLIKARRNERDCIVVVLLTDGMGFRWVRRREVSMEEAARNGYPARSRSTTE